MDVEGKDSPISGFRRRSRTTRVVLYFRTSRNAFAPAVDTPVACMSSAVNA